MERELRVGLPGIGSVSRTILPEIEGAPNVKLAAVADVRQEPLDMCRERYGAKGYTSVEAMCDSADIDAVWICTPNMYHAEHAIIAAEHGKHVICEKPMAVTLDDAHKMVDSVERNGVRYVQGHSKIFDAPVRRMREVVSSGELGRVIQISNWEYKPWLSGQPRLPVRGRFQRGRRRPLPPGPASDRRRPWHRRRDGQESARHDWAVEPVLPGR